MACLLCHLHFWTHQPLAPATANQIGIHFYQPKTAAGTMRIDTEMCRRYWAEGRGILWSLPNQKPERLRDNLKECEELLLSQRILCLQWKTQRHFVILLSNGILLVFGVAKQSGDIESVLIDRSLIPKLHGFVDKALFLDGSLVVLYTEGNKVSLIGPAHHSRRNSVSMDGPTALNLSNDKFKKRIQRAATVDLKSFDLEVKGMPDHQIVRQMLVNPQSDLLVIWWSDEQENGLRWSAMADGECNNVVLIKLKSNGKLELLTKLQTTCNPITLYFSKTHWNIMYVFGQCTDNSSSYQLSIIDSTDKKSIKQTLETVLLIDDQVNVCASNKDESLLAVGCDTGVIMVFDLKRDTVRKCSAFFSPISHISWHPAGGVFFVCGSGGEIQCLDPALNQVQFLLASELEVSPNPLLELGSFCMNPVQLEHTGWASVSREGEGHGGCYDNFVMIFNQGPIVLLRIELGVHSKGRLSIFELMGEYIQHNQLHHASQLLLSLNWELYPQDCYYCLTLFMDHLLMLPLSSVTEELMESALGSFFASSINEPIFDEFQSSVCLLSRRFFFKLLKNKKFEKAFRLAVDMSSNDLFMELHYAALESKQMPLAELSLKKADLLKKEDKVHTKRVSASSDISVTVTVTDDDYVIHNPSVTSHPVKDSIKVLSSSNESINKENTIQIETGKCVVNKWTSHDEVNVINFGYFS